MRFKLVLTVLTVPLFFCLVGCEGKGNPDVMLGCNDDPEVYTCQAWHDPDLTLSVSNLNIVSGKRECTDSTDNSACCEGLDCYSGVVNDHIEVRAIDDPGTWFSDTWEIKVLGEATPDYLSSNCVWHPPVIEVEFEPIQGPKVQERPIGKLIPTIPANTSFMITVPMNSVLKGEEIVQLEICKIVWEINGAMFHDHFASTEPLGCLGWAECK